MLWQEKSHPCRAALCQGGTCHLLCPEKCHLGDSQGWDVARIWPHPSPHNQGGVFWALCQEPTSTGTPGHSCHLSQHRRPAGVCARALTGGFKGSLDSCWRLPGGDAVPALPSPVPTPQGRSWDGPGTIWGTVSPGDSSSCRHAAAAAAALSRVLASSSAPRWDSRALEHRGDLSGSSGSMWAQQGWLAPLPSQGWRVKTANGETEARLGRGVTREQRRTLRSPRPIRCLWQRFRRLWQRQMLQEPKNKRSCWPGVVQERVPGPPRAGVRRIWRQSRPGTAESWRCAQEMPGSKRAGGCPPSLSPLCAALCLVRGVGVGLGTWGQNWAAGGWDGCPRGGTLRNSTGVQSSGSRGDTPHAPTHTPSTHTQHPEEFQRGAELEEPWGHSPCAHPAHTGGGGETEAEPARVALHEALGLWCHPWGVHCPPRI